jgi:hypothetical protein
MTQRLQVLYIPGVSAIRYRDNMVYVCGLLHPSMRPTHHAQRVMGEYVLPCLQPSAGTVEFIAHRFLTLTSCLATLVTPFNVNVYTAS